MRTDQPRLRSAATSSKHDPSSTRGTCIHPTILLLCLYCREAISWSGPPHPQLGNALNLRVREAAKETLDEVFRISAASSAGAMSGAGSNLQGRIQGYGSTTGGKIQSAGPPGGGGSGTGGFSNTGTGGKKYGGISSDDYFAGSTRGQWSTWSDASQSALVRSADAGPMALEERSKPPLSLSYVSPWQRTGGPGHQDVRAR